MIPFLTLWGRLSAHFHNLFALVLITLLLSDREWDAFSLGQIPWKRYRLWSTCELYSWYVPGLHQLRLWSLEWFLPSVFWTLLFIGSLRQNIYRVTRAMGRSGGVMWRTGRFVWADRVKVIFVRTPNLYSLIQICRCSWKIISSLNNTFFSILSSGRSSCQRRGWNNNVCFGYG